MKLYDLKAGLNTRRVRIFLAEKGVKLETIDLDMDDLRSSDFLAKNPLGTLPMLELDDGSFLTESIAICRYFEDLHPEPPLFGITSLERARIEMWNRRMEIEILMPTVSTFRNQHPFWAGRIEQFADFGAWSRQHLLDRLAWLDRELAGCAFIVGGCYTVADVTAQCALIVAKACKSRSARRCQISRIGLHG